MCENIDELSVMYKRRTKQKIIVYVKNANTHEKKKKVYVKDIVVNFHYHQQF